MTANWVSTQISCGPNSGRIVDTARGILIGLRRCPSEIAFDELFSAAQRHNVPVFAMAKANSLHCFGATAAKILDSGSISSPTIRIARLPARANR